jgi:hypothetical protein
MTINKAQGQTIPNVGIYLPEPVFSHGQLYVAYQDIQQRYLPNQTRISTHQEKVQKILSIMSFDLIIDVSWSLFFFSQFMS